MDPRGELQPGDVFAGHRVEGVAGRGGMGVVYRATALDLDRTVALKLIAPSMASDGSFRDRFIRETRVAASIDHPNVIPVFYAGEEDERLYIAMRYVEGDDLRTLIRRETRLPADRAAHIVGQVGAALDAAHARGIVHRDVKPANVLMPPPPPQDHAYLTDFGLTKRVHSGDGDESQATRAGGWVGTLGYVSPEQIRGERVDARADVYALGCILFHALTGHTPFVRESDEATLWAHLNAEPPAITHEVPELPADFEHVLRRALAKDPDDRYQSAGDLGRAALAAAGRAPVSQPERVVARGAAAPDATGSWPTDGETVASPTLRVPPSARPGGATGRGPRPRRIGVALAALAALVIAGVVVALLAGGSDDDAPPGVAATTGTTTAKPVARPAVAGRLLRTYGAGIRPNTITVAGGRVWVGSVSEQRLRLLSSATGAASRKAPKAGVGVAALDGGFGSVWIAKQTQSLLRYTASGGARQGAPVALPPGQATAVAVGLDAVWVGSRAGNGHVQAQTVAKVTPSTGATQVIPQAAGVQDLAVGYGAVWVVNRSRATLTRVDPGSGDGRAIELGGDPQRVAVGGGSVWVTNDAGFVTQVSPGRRRVVRRIPVGRQPRGIAVGANAVWVANQLDGTATRIDPRTGRKVGHSIAVGSNPFAVAVNGRNAWITLLGDNAVARVRF